MCSVRPSFQWNYRRKTLYVINSIKSNDWPTHLNTLDFYMHLVYLEIQSRTHMCTQRHTNTVWALVQGLGWLHLLHCPHQDQCRWQSETRGLKHTQPHTHTVNTICLIHVAHSYTVLIKTNTNKHAETHTHTVTGSSGCLRAPAGPCHYPVLYPKHAVLISKLWLADDCMTAADQVPFSPGSQTATQSCPISGSPNTLSY